MHRSSDWRNIIIPGSAFPGGILPSPPLPTPSPFWNRWLMKIHSIISVFMCCPHLSVSLSLTPPPTHPSLLPHLWGQTSAVPTRFVAVTKDETREPITVSGACCSTCFCPMPWMVYRLHQHSHVPELAGCCTSSGRRSSSSRCLCTVYSDG